MPVSPDFTSIYHQNFENFDNLVIDFDIFVFPCAAGAIFFGCSVLNVVRNALDVNFVKHFLLKFPLTFSQKRERKTKTKIEIS